MRPLKIALISASRIKSCRSSVPAAHTYDEIGFKYRGVSTSPARQRIPCSRPYCRTHRLSRAALSPILPVTVKQHIKEEGEELFPELQSAKMDIGEELAERKEELMSEFA
jgi:hypothetical protein